MNISDGSGGGGGGSFVFLLNNAREPVPILVAGGGGGLGVGTFNDDIQHGRGMEDIYENRTGKVFDFLERRAGAGGGWMDNEETSLSSSNMTGASLLSGAVGGIACYQRGIHGFGGFGGGGGGCTKGGAGGGYAGGSSVTNSNNGQGGTSFMSPSRAHEQLSNILLASNSGEGSVIIIPAIEGCGCDYRCVALDEYRAEVACICPQGWILNPFNLTQCESKSFNTNFFNYLQMYLFFFLVTGAVLPDQPMSFVIPLFGVLSIALILALSFLMVMLCKFFFGNVDVFKHFNFFSSNFPR